MPSYHRLGQIPPKRHTQFRKPDGTLYNEELFGTEGFSGDEWLDGFRLSQSPGGDQHEPALFSGGAAFVVRFD